jgi:hypothetical protein
MLRVLRTDLGAVPRGSRSVVGTIVSVTVLWYALAVALGFGFGVFAVRRFHRAYRVRNPRWLRFAAAVGLGVPLVLVVAWMVGELNAFYLTGAFSFTLTLLVGELLWRPRAALDVTSRAS